MTTTWPAAPGGARWRDLDSVLDRVDSVVGVEARPGAVHQVRWDPSGRTRVTFERLDGDTVVLEAVGGDLRVRRLAEDPALPGLAALLDGDAVRERLHGLLPHPVQRCAVTVISYRPGSRCVVRYAVRGAGHSGSILYGKALTGDFDVCHETQAALAEAPGCRVPGLVAAWPDLRVLVSEAAPGRSASAVLADPSTSVSARRALARQLGSLLAAVHRCAPGPHAARRTHSDTAEVGELDRYLDAAWRSDAEAALSLGWLVRRLEAARPPTRMHVLGHGSYRPGQVVVDGADLVLLDLDSAGTAAPERDLGNVMAYLDWSFLCHARAGGQRLSAEVVVGYLADGGTLDRETLTWWRAASMAKIAGRRYRGLDTAHWGAVPSLLNAARWVLEEGARASSLGAGHLRPGSTSEVTDAPAMSRMLAEVLQPLRTEVAEAVTVTESSTVRIAAGRRVVERYRLSGALEGHDEVILKAYAEPERAAITHENLGVFAALTDPGVRVGTPAPVGHLPDRGIVLCRAVSGRTVTELAEEAAADAAARCGRWLRDVHGSRVRLGRDFDLPKEVSNVAAWATEIGRTDDRLADAAEGLARTLARAATRLPQIRTGPIHKDLHLDHVIVDDSGWAWVIDLDEARTGDPAFDVAHLRAYAIETGTERVAEVFVSAYGALDGPEAELRLAYFHAYTLLKITKQQSRTHGQDDEHVQRSLRRLAEGVSWLTG